MGIDALNFRLNDNTYSLPVTVNSNVGAYGTLEQRSGNRNQKVLLAPYKDTSKTVVYSNGRQRFYYSANYPSIHCRKNNKNYSCCNNWQDYTTSTWTFDYAYTGSTSKTVSYADNSYLGSSYNKYAYQTKLAPYGMVTPSRSGYTFKGWNTSADDKGTAYKSTSTMRNTDRNATFFALWARIDAGSYGASETWNKLTSWFDNSFTTVKTSNHTATLTIGSSTVSVKVGSTIQLAHTTSNSGYDHQYHIVIDGTAYEVYWKNWFGQTGGNGMTISNGWLTDKCYPDSLDIVKGTYSPNSFKNLISQFISVNGSRTVSQSFTAIVNGIPVTVPAGGTLYYRHPYTSNPDVYIVGFTSYLTEINKAATDTFSSGKTYVVYCSPQSGYFDKYTNYPITLAQDIVFN